MPGRILRSTVRQLSVVTELGPGDMIPSGIPAGALTVYRAFAALGDRGRRTVRLASLVGNVGADGRYWELATHEDPNSPWLRW
jgi:hypothetical protein